VIAITIANAGMFHEHRNSGEFRRRLKQAVHSRVGAQKARSDSRASASRQVDTRRL
jgi:hypothetical protein